MEHPQPKETAPGRALVLAIGLLACILIVAFARNQPPPPLSADAPRDEFSAGRAMSLIEELSDGKPHPVGSPANDLVLERLVSILETLGYEPEIQSTIGCAPHGHCAAVRNVLARRRGSDSEGAILLVSHYDSVPAGPGAADDLSGVATLLEIARIVMLDPQPANDILFLFTDGEEEGLIGAEAFAAEHPAMRDVAVVFNLEGRGTGGPSLMFQTGPASAGLVRLFGSLCPRPLSSSISAAVYRAMPNDTDFSVFIRANRPGLNFAFVRGASRYHTPLDRPENLDPGSLQHHGDCLLGLSRALSRGEPPSDEEELVWFDWLGFGLVSWPARWSVPMALLALASVLVPALRASSLGLLRMRPAIIGALVLPLFMIGALLAGILVLFLIRWVSGSSLAWPATLAPAVIGFWCLGAAVAWAGAAGIARWTTLWGAWAGLWLGAALLSVVVAATSPEFVAPLVVPALIAGTTAGALSLTRATPALWAALSTAAGALAAGVVAFGPMLSLHDGLGMVAGPLLSALVAILAATLLPLFAGSRAHWLPSAMAGGIALVAFAAACVLPASSPSIPRHINLSYHESAPGEARWLASASSGRLPEALRSRFEYEPEPTIAFPFARAGRKAHEGPATSLDTPAPELIVLESVSEGEGRRVKARLKSNRGARQAVLYLPPEASLVAFEVEGRRLGALSEDDLGWWGGWQPVGFAGLPSEGVVIELWFASPGPARAIILDQVDGLPTPVGEARPADAVPQHDGDTWVVTREIEF